MSAATDGSIKVKTFQVAVKVFVVIPRQVREQKSDCSGLREEGRRIIEDRYSRQIF